MNMFKPTKAKTIQEYIAAIPDDRRDVILSLDRFIKKTAPKLKPHFAYNMLGYGSMPYKNYKGETIDWPVVSLANQKHYVSLYVCAVKDKRYIAEIYKDTLGKVSVGKSCIRFKTMEDIRLDTLQTILRYAEAHPGFE